MKFTRYALMNYSHVMLKICIDLYKWRDDILLPISHARFKTSSIIVQFVAVFHIIAHNVIM